MKRIRIAVLSIALVAMFMFSAAAALSYVFQNKNVSSRGVGINQTSGTGIYHLYATATGDYTGKTLSGKTSTTLYPRSANYGKSHYMMVEYSSYPSFTYTIK